MAVGWRRRRRKNEINGGCSETVVGDSGAAAALCTLSLSPFNFSFCLGCRVYFLKTTFFGILSGARVLCYYTRERESEWKGGN